MTHLHLSRLCILEQGYHLQQLTLSFLLGIINTMDASWIRKLLLFSEHKLDRALCYFCQVQQQTNVAKRCAHVFRLRSLPRNSSPNKATTNFFIKITQFCSMPPCVLRYVQRTVTLCSAARSHDFTHSKRANRNSSTKTTTYRIVHTTER